ncbi:galactoside alpha-(1,2)-fucosyltransferase 1-like [Mercenaria mercenaria]|uniref:galactoside alpha-(1,2)-fucosyltransferase 1-like n=1 Tax=Mercenaria mercenaria TaxID=6596 RepID=UPI00234F6355|nr:galactoside alpha-(1,2)-fucosyltransferase 1-like [Mercenaria mercenaria]XP_053406084.1 galactoside alpha-(1,2)-fucosyltransferase 1-like [Mercenaria mercenaria]XP_053406085.1 galactoside alpha-(1,2)-fucosyltransferase 1-like [Mercenaria mercenaria]XP_053406086.1 galactoside alpha-(1,2)-fucosyltransferase 1-like [Mercenaria mercenaria]XP_053406087.1 galactoside alpha-(1,2)-fucosyltransferase 1-like [Mercenaria mercenaria]
MSLTGAIRWKFFAILISILIVLYIMLTQTWKNDAAEYSDDTDRRHELLNSQSCFTIIWDKSAFSDFIRGKSIENGRNISTFRESSCHHFMELTSSGGRTGNQLFQIAALLGISFEYDYIPIIEPSFPLLKYFDLPNVFRMILNNVSVCSSQPFGIYYECSDSSKNDKAFNMTIHGFFQSWKYFKNSASIIRAVLKIRTTYLQTARHFLKIHNKVGLKNICIHVRRTDMTTNSNKNTGYAVAPISFIYKAINFCETNFKKAVFFVLSDDIKWCRKNIKRDVKFSSFEDPGYDLALMTLCDHVVVTSGTFGWWGAWLSNRTAVYFNGYPRPGSLLDKSFSREDYYPPNWIGLS